MKTFDEWWFPVGRGGKCESAAKAAWNYQQAKISELQSVIDEIMEIAHLGGLRNVDNEDALIAIRHLTKSRFEEIKGA